MNLRGHVDWENLLVELEKGKDGAWSLSGDP